jgi:hypothetical protein
MSETGVINRLLALVRALLPEDWFGRAGKRFSETASSVSRFADEHNVRPSDVAQEGVELIRTALHGKANKELAAALRDFAQAEQSRIETELQRRALESRVRKEEAEAALAELQVVQAEADLLRKLQDLGVILRRDPGGRLTVLPLASGIDLRTLAATRLQDVAINAERVVLGAIILDNSLVTQCVGLHPQHFSSEPHQLIYQAILELVVSARQIDFVTLVEQLGVQKRLEAGGGVQYVTSLTDHLPRIPNRKQHVDFLLNARGSHGDLVATGRP